MPKRSFRYHLAMLTYAWVLAIWVVAPIMGALIFLAPRYAGWPIWLFPPIFFLAYVYGVPWLLHRYPKQAERMSKR